MKIALLGDIALFGNNCLLQNPLLLDKLTELKSILNEHDYVVANLEAPLTECSKMNGSKSVYINSHSKNIEVLKYLGINSVSLANNHTYDFGSDGILDTKSLLESNCIDWFGIDGKLLKINTPKQKVAIHGYCSYNTNPSYCSFNDLTNNSKGLNLLEYNIVYNKMMELDLDGYFNIISSHSGVENVSLPSIDDIAFARGLSASFNYVYHGHHPHVIQGIEKHNQSVIAYSQGNCIFDDIYDHRTGNILVEQSFVNSCSYILSVNIIDNKIDSYSTIPFSFYKGRLIINCDGARKILEERSELLNLSDAKNLSLRKNDINKISHNWSSRRNLSWFLSRLRLSTLFRLINNKVNSYLYMKKFKNLIGGK